MNPSPIAQATRFWQDMLGQQHETPRSFLWLNVDDMEPDEAGPIDWHNQQPKTRIYLRGDKVICVLGTYTNWRRQWQAFMAWPPVVFTQTGLN